VEIRELPLAELQDATAVYVTNSLIGIWPVRSLCGAVNQRFPVLETRWTTALKQALNP
jgi:branched-subunit amino acid aminotransferase/4-amino-4-deoxychorismate lyase